MNVTLTAHELANTCELCGSMEEARSLLQHRLQSHREAS